MQRAEICEKNIRHILFNLFAYLEKLNIRIAAINLEKS